MTGRNVDAAEAERIGLVNKVVEGDLLEAGVAFAAKLTRYSLPVLELVRGAIRRSRDVSFEDALRVEKRCLDIGLQAGRCRGGNGPRSQKKRRPTFKDR